MTAKRLTVTYGATVLYDDEPAKITFSEIASGAFELKAGPEGPNVLEQLATAMKQQNRQALASRPAINGSLQEETP